MAGKQELMQFWKSNFRFSQAVVEAFESVDRSLFVPGELALAAYDDSPLPTLRGKTISQPTTVMIMTDALELKEGGKVLEVGTGSGYQSAIIAKIVKEKGKVVSTEIVPELVGFARENLARAGITNVKVLEEDGTKGVLSEAPFDAIIITAACREFPKPLLDQLKVGGIIVGPVGDAYSQTMLKARKQSTGPLEIEYLGPFIFSPLYGKYGFEV